MKQKISWKIGRWLLFIVLPFNLVGLLAATFSYQNAEKQMQNYIESIANLAMSQLDSRIYASNTFFFNIEEDRADFKMYAAQGERNTELLIAETSLASYFDRCTDNNTLYVDYIYWMSEEYQRFFSSMADLLCMDRQGMFDSRVEIRRLLSAEDDLYTNWEYVNISGCEWIIKVYKKNDFKYGGLFSLDEIRSSIIDNAKYTDVEIKFMPAEQRETHNRQEFSYTVESKYSHIKMQICMPKSSVLKGFSIFELISTVMLILFVLAIPVLFLILNRIVVKPLRDIERVMVRIKDGDIDYNIPDNKKVALEFQEISSTFNEMHDAMKVLKIENYEREIHKQKMELRNLQLQIRPHFLMNMFNLLFSFAQIENYQSIQKLALYLSDYFRHIFQSDSDTQPFEKEFMLIQKYLEVSELRYPGWYEVIFNVDADALMVRVPPLLIHNFVENIFKHVIDYSKITHIRLEAYTTKNEAIFMIVDDGCGMPQELVDDINSGEYKMSHDDRVHVGVKNSYRRLKSIYGDKAQLLVDSIEGQGTCFTIVIPLEEEDELTDC